MALSKACGSLCAVCSVATLGAATVTTLYLDGLSCETDEDAQREVLSVAVTKYQLSEIKRLVCILETEGLLYYRFAEYGRISV